VGTNQTAIVSRAAEWVVVRDLSLGAQNCEWRVIQYAAADEEAGDDGDGRDDEQGD
jgi:hypothetical protein